MHCQGKDSQIGLDDAQKRLTKLSDRILFSKVQSGKKGKDILLGNPDIRLSATSAEFEVSYKCGASSGPICSCITTAIVNIPGYQH